MFRVENPDFIADKLASELLPDQEFREVLKNALEAVERRMSAEGSEDGGRIEFDVDWNLHARTGHWFVSCADNGDGMNRSEIEKYTTTLAVQGAGRNQSLCGNQGMGLKISGPTRHKKGVLIRSLKNGERTSVQIGWDGFEYGLIPGPEDQVVWPVSSNLFPTFVNEQGSGTVVTFLGSTDGANTFVPPGRPNGWLLKYLNQRFFRPSEGGIKVVVRVPSGEPQEWPHSVEDADERMQGQGGKSFNLTTVNGTGWLWDNASDRLGHEWRGVVPLPGNPQAGVPPADVHWWVLPTGRGIDLSSRTHTGGSLAVLFQGELYEWRTSNQANPYFARLGVIFGKTRIAFVLEPKGTAITSDFARAHVLVGGTPALESDAWLDWAEQFREQMPDKIRQTMVDEQARLQADDPDQEKRIQDRLRDVMRLLRPRKFRRKAMGAVRATAETSGADGGVGPMVEFPQVQSDNTRGPRTRSARGERSRGIGALLADLDELNGQPAAETAVTANLKAKWVSELEGDDATIVNGNGSGLRDRAAALAGEDGRTAHLLLLNRDFRGYQTILAAVNDWANPEGDDDKAKKIESLTREWVTQKMIEAVQGLRQLENGRTWTTQTYNDGLSPVALTGAFMADRYHTLAEVKRATGALRQGRRAATTAEEVS